MPRIRHFIRQHDPDTSPIPAADLAIIPDKKPDRWNRAKHGMDALKKRLAEKAKTAKTPEDA